MINYAWAALNISRPKGFAVLSYTDKKLSIIMQYLSLLKLFIGLNSIQRMCPLRG